MSKVYDIPTLLTEIRKRPSLYHGGEERCIDLLAAFLGGILYMQNVHKIPTEHHLNNFNWGKFENWVKTEFNEKNLNLNSFGLSKNLSLSKAEAFDLWFKWYDQFQKGKK